MLHIMRKILSLHWYDCWSYGLFCQEQIKEQTFTRKDSDSTVDPLKLLSIKFIDFSISYINSKLKGCWNTLKATGKHCNPMILQPVG